MRQLALVLYETLWNSVISAFLSADFTTFMAYSFSFSPWVLNAFGIVFGIFAGSASPSAHLQLLLPCLVNNFMLIIKKWKYAFGFWGLGCFGCINHLAAIHPRLVSFFSSQNQCKRFWPGRDLYNEPDRTNRPIKSISSPIDEDHRFGNKMRFRFRQKQKNIPLLISM